MGQANGTNAAATQHPLPISKLRGVPHHVRFKLKSQRITTCGQLLAAAAEAHVRTALAESTGIEPDILLRLVRRADIARISGIGTVFGLMLEEVGVVDVAGLAASEAQPLHTALRAYNLEERLARRAPTLEEVVDWITTARSLPVLVTYDLTEDRPLSDH
jgi:predicted flap endonuclease-1-like 5' DNA nuclease